MKCTTGLSAAALACGVRRRRKTEEINYPTNRRKSYSVKMKARVCEDAF